MAKVLAEPGRYISEESTRRQRRALAMVLLLTALSFAFLGFLAGQLLRKSPIWTHVVVALGFIYLLRTAFVQMRSTLGRAEGAPAGTRLPNLTEGVIGRTVRELPQEFEIIAELATPLGRLEQVVIGPTGVFVLEAKNWKGTVSTDGRGELLWNGHPTDRPFVQEFANRLEKVRSELERRLPGLRVAIQGLLVFTSAGIENNPTNGHSVRFVRDHQLSEQILAGKSQTTLTPQQVDAIARAFFAMGQMAAAPGIRAG